MTLGSTEHQEMILLFERTIGKLSGVYCSERFHKESKDIWKLGRIYQDGQVNELFRVWSLGYSAGRAVYLNQ